jgi:hypothetical protein
MKDDSFKYDSFKLKDMLDEKMIKAGSPWQIKRTANNIYLKSLDGDQVHQLVNMPNGLQEREVTLFLTGMLTGWNAKEACETP